MRIFAWGDSEEALNIPRWGEYDYKNSTFDASFLLGHVKPGEDHGKAIVNFPGWSLARLAQWRCPPSPSTPIVDWAAQAVIRKFADEGQITFYPLDAVCKDGVSGEFSFIAPRLRLRCIDFAKSDLTMGLVDSGHPYVSWWKQMSFLDDCLGSAHIAWEHHLAGVVVVSEPLRDALMSLGGKGLAIVRPEDYKCY